MKRYFIPRNSALYSMIAHMSPRMRYFSLISVLVCVVTGWYFLIYCPIARALDAHLQAISCQHQDIVAVRKAQECKDALDASCLELLKHKAFTAIDHNEADSCIHMLSIIESISLIQMQLVSYTVDKLQKNDMHQIYHMHATLKGSMPQLGILFKKWAELSDPILCTRCVCTALDGKLFSISLDAEKSFLCLDGAKKTLQLRTS